MPSFVAEGPIWLQVDDTEADGDFDDCDDEHGDDEEDSAPSVTSSAFVMQRSEELIRGINLGDSGIMCVFVEAAW